jgi:ABC-type protease/lipase transport system fused ATPase/permease subunit
VLAVVDQLACYLGFLAIFWYFHWIIGTIFLAATVVAFLTLWTAEKRLRETARKSAASRNAEAIPE